MKFDHIKSDIIGTINAMRDERLSPQYDAVKNNHKYLSAIDIIDLQIRVLFSTCEPPIDTDITKAYTTVIVYNELLRIHKIIENHYDKEFINIFDEVSQNLFITSLS